MKVAICIPCYGNPEVMFMQCLLNMVNHFTNAKVTGPDGEPLEIEWDTFIVGSSMLTESRHRLVAEALAWGADYMLWLDADHTFPPDTLLRLWCHNKAVVGCNYPRRITPTGPTAAKDGKLVYTTEEKAKDDLLEEVDHMGFGVLLVNMQVFDALQVKCEEEGKSSFLPLFMFEPTENHVGMIGEDVFFFRKLREAGVKSYCDHALSWDVGHIHKSVMRNSHANAQKADWEQKEAEKADKFRKAAEALEA